MTLVELLGNQLQTKNGVVSTASLLNGKKNVALYFSAHWCPPCRGFTPVLAEFYDQIKEESGDSLEIVFVSSDSDDASFAEYYGSMPWVSLPFSNRDKAQDLGSKFGVRGIPALIVLDHEGNVKDADGRSTVMGAKGNTQKALAKWA